MPPGPRPAEDAGVSARDEHRHVATGDAAPAVPTVREEATDPGDTDDEVLQAVVDFIGDLVESDEDGDAPRAHGGGNGAVSPKAPHA